ncbi:hypothetical protein RB195_017144 [Necator americanus]|uniref:Uncharacterized protein n=1 Tax=Necator americanus TaxID=51031 RepID=A0ABR1C3U3_NECAM
MWGDKEKHDPLLLGGFSMGNNGLHHHSHLYREFHRGMNGKSRPVVLWKGETARKKRFGWFPVGFWDCCGLEMAGKNSENRRNNNHLILRQFLAGKDAENITR